MHCQNHEPPCLRDDCARCIVMKAKSIHKQLDNLSHEYGGSVEDVLIELIDKAIALRSEDGKRDE